MTNEQFDKLEANLIEAVDGLSSGVTSTADAQAIAALVQSLVSLETVRQSAPGGQ